MCLRTVSMNFDYAQGFPKGELGRLLALMHELDHNGLSSLLIPLRQRPRSLSEASPTRSKGNSP